MTDKVVYLMRGLPSCGKSYTAKQLTAEQGIICETDLFFYTQIGNDPNQYDFNPNLMGHARDWNFTNFKQSVNTGISPIVVDRGNSLNLETQRYVHYAIAHQYNVEFREPQSDWWKEIRVLLKYKTVTKEILYQWSDRLAQINRATHRTPVASIRHWMDSWRYDLTVEEIINFRSIKNKLKL